MNSATLKIRTAIAALALASFVPACAQETEAPAQTPGAAPAEIVVDLDEVLSYRFRLTAEDNEFGLAVRNNSGRPGQFYLLPVDPGKDGEAHAAETIWLQPGQGLFFSAAQLDWGRRPLIYGAASRRLTLELAHPDLQQALVIQTSRQETEYDLFSSERYRELAARDQTCRIETAGDPDSPAVEAHDQAGWHSALGAHGRKFRGRARLPMLARCSAR